MNFYFEKWSDTPVYILHKTLVVMKLIIVLLTFGLCQVYASGFAQKITLNEKNASLESVINKIRKQSGYDFIGDAQLIKQVTGLSVVVKDAPLKDVLNQIFKNTNITYRIDTDIIVLKPKAKVTVATQQLIIKGRVINEKGEGLSDASISLSQSEIATKTNKEGFFTLQIPNREAIISVSYVGYQTLTVKAKEDMGVIALTPSLSTLDGVDITVSTGYQTLSKERATGSFSQVGQSVLGKRPTSNLSSALQGMVAGMQAKENEDGSVDFLIRGNSTLYADSKPLVVVDGFPVSSSNFSDINPNDVESVTVLKDAAAASIWGARAANGVIVIVTKKAKADNRLSIQGSAFSRISNRLDLDYLLTQANSADHIAYERKAFENNWVFYPYAGSFGDIANSLTLAQEALYANQNGTMTLADMNAELDRLSKINNRGQIRDLLTQRAVLNQYNVNLQASNERVRNYTSVLYENNKGAFQKNGYDRFNLNFNNDFKITSFLQFTLGANLQYKKQQYGGATISEIEGLSPYELLLNQDGSYGINLNTYNREQLGLIPTEKFTYSDWSYNLLREVRGRDFTDERINARIQTGLNLKIIPGLTFDTKFQYERNKIDRERQYDENTLYVRSMVNSKTEYDDNTKTVGRAFLPKGGIMRRGIQNYEDGITLGELGAEDIQSFVFRNQLNFDKVFGSDHQISAIAGMEVSQYLTTGTINPAVYGYFGDKLQATTPPYGYGSSVDQFTDFEGYPTTLIGGNTQFSWQKNKFISLYGNAAYTYLGRYTLSGSLRSDASNFITDDPKLRWSPLWSVGAKWNLSKENFMSSKDYIDRLEMRLTYGKNGNMENSTSTATLLNVGGSLNTSTGTITATIADNGNPSLRWEKTTSTNFGIDFSFFNSKFFGSLDLYHKKGSGIIGLIALPSATGTQAQKFNNAEITNKGFELAIGTNVDISKNIQYTTNFNYAYNANNIDKLYNPSLYTYQLISRAFVENRPVGSLYAFDYIGMIDGVPHVAGPNNTQQTFNDISIYNRGLGLPFLHYMGTDVPPHTLGWTNNVQVGNFNIMFIILGKMGGVYRNPTFNYASLVGSGKTFVNKYVNDVLAGNPDIPGFALPDEQNLYLWDRYSEALSSQVEKSSYIEFKELSLGYRLANRWTEAIRMNNINVFVQARDLGLIWRANSKNYNPDWLPGTNRPAQSYTLGINFQF
ncbi:TonB-linked outer membrane protein, SusC/RagA family [Sphingobacterium nematocida]|uniref:TonB-linked outer membrane protein, SusC/RagA family n=2 Tax=Sphingobacterium nematocida TaxID=1513896 RepID=A0A1T5GEZ5_9SPHI|nr:TonB-linked outer membrane protein, SusC/RagA family [Sphingobacterium nematocida]